MEQSGLVIAALLLHRRGTENGAPTPLVLLRHPHFGCCRVAFNAFVIDNTNAPYKRNWRNRRNPTKLILFCLYIQETTLTATSKENLCV